MLWKTHIAFAFLCGLVAVKFIEFSAGFSPKFIFFSILLLASIMPDVDEPRSKLGSKIPIMPKLIKMLLGHRGIFHSAWLPMVISFLLLTFYEQQYAMAFTIGYLSHIFIDGFTKSGVNYLHPFATLHLRGFVETGDMKETLVFSLIILAIVFRLFIW